MSEFVHPGWKLAFVHCRAWLGTPELMVSIFPSLDVELSRCSPFFGRVRERDDRYDASLLVLLLFVCFFLLRTCLFWAAFRHRQKRMQVYTCNSLSLFPPIYIYNIYLFIYTPSHRCSKIERAKAEKKIINE